MLSLQKYSPKAIAKSEGVLGFTGTFEGSFISSVLFWAGLFLSFFSFLVLSSKGGRRGFLLNFIFKAPKASSRAKLSKFFSGYFS